MSTKTIVMSAEDHRLMTRYGGLRGLHSAYSDDYTNQIVRGVTEDDATAADRMIEAAINEMRLDLDAFADLSLSSRIALHSAVVWLEQLPSTANLWRVATKEQA